MGTDYLQLLDRRTTELIVNGTASDLAGLVDLRSTPVGRPPMWQAHWNEEQQALEEFPFGTRATRRLRTLLEEGASIADIKQGLIHDLCIGDMLPVDYWGCWAEVFSDQTPGLLTWEEFIASICNDSSDYTNEAVGLSGCYILSDENVSTILRSLQSHLAELTIMGEPELDRLSGWQALARKHPEICVLYQMDF